MDRFMQEAIAEARRGLEEGGIPIGSVLVLRGEIVASGHKMRVQRGSAILHAEMACIENAGRLTAKEYAASTLYSTLSPCDMCSGMSLLYKIPRIVVGENVNFRGTERVQPFPWYRFDRAQRPRVHRTDAQLHHRFPSTMERRYRRVARNRFEPIVAHRE